jgi:3-oxoacyl-[acyl-carrier-protein] synthase II
MLNRVVVTGIGVLSALGNNAETFWNNIVNGKSGAAPITRFDASLFRSKFACELKDLDATKLLDRNDIKRNDLFTQYALVATDQAIADSGFEFEKMSPFDVGVIWGCAHGGTITFEDQMREYINGGNAPRFNPFFLPKVLVNMASGMISIRNGYMGPNYTTVSACASSNTAMMDAFNTIRLGKAKIIITGGSEAPISEGAYGGYCALKAMSARNDDPQHASRPFDTERDGFVMGEGSGALVLEDYEHAKARCAKIYAEVVGSASTGDAYHMTATHPEGLGAIHAMKLALKEAGLGIQDVDYINPHATSTHVGDLSETKAISALTGTEKTKLHISATKSMTGHLLGAAGAVEGIICLLAIRDGVVPPTINTENIDPAIPQNLNIVLKEALQKKVNVAMSNTFGFGGHNGIVVFKGV